jgi:hypothetical protein
MYDYDFMDLIQALSISQRAGRATLVPFLVRLSKSLAEIPYQRTLLPATAPREFWQRSAEIERQREQLYLDIWRETKGKVFIPYRRYYTNFDEWLRSVPSWIRMTDDLLGQRDALIYQFGLAQPDFVANLIEQHRAAQRSWRQHLIVLMSLELYLRAYFGAGLTA